MTPKGPPRVRGLILALVTVLIVMSYAFWRAAARPRGQDGVKTTGERDDQAAATSHTPPAPPAAVVDAGANGAGGQGPVATTAPAPEKRPKIATAAVPGELSEAQLMTRLRAIKDGDPTAAVSLAREGNRRFPDSADAPERTSILIHALVAGDKGSEARGEAEQMVNHYPDSSWVREVEHFTGAHRHRAVGVTDAGQIIFR